MQQRHPERDAEEAADDERKQSSGVEAAANRGEGQDLADKRAEHDERADDGGIDRPGPDADRDQAERKAGEALDKAAEHGAERDDGDQRRRHRRNASADQRSARYSRSS